MIWTIFELILGAALAGITLRDVFDTVIVPGGSHTTLHMARRLVILLLPVWKRLRGGRRGLSTMFAPFILVASFALWMLLLTLGFGLMAHALRNSFAPPLGGFEDALYAVGGALVTIGDGGHGVHGGGRWVILAAGFCGLAVMTMAVTYLLEVQSSIALRDAGILKLATAAGEPPSALALLEKYAAIDNQGELAHVLRDGRDWCARVRQSHASHPSLIYFRTSGTGAGWPAALGALLDLALIVELWVDAPHARGLAILLREDGWRMAEELSGLIRLAPEPRAVTDEDVAALGARLAAAGYPQRTAFDPAHFARCREAHAAATRALARQLGRDESPLLPRRC